MTDNYKQLVERISQSTKLSVEDIERRIEAKRAKLSGLISLEGAAHVIAAELGIGLEKQNYKIWQDEFHPKAIYTQEFLLQKMEYMHNNPVRKGLVLKPEYWRYSSARTYLNGEENDVNICMDRLFDDS